MLMNAELTMYHLQHGLALLLNAGTLLNSDKSTTFPLNIILTQFSIIMYESCIHVTLVNFFLNRRYLR